MSGTAANKPGRYQRSTGGLIGAMIVLVVVVFVLSRALGAFRDEPEFAPSDSATVADYEQDVRALAADGFEFSYPTTIPVGWRINDLEVRRDQGDFRLALLTLDGGFAGVYSGEVEESEEETVEDLLDRFVDPSPTPGEPVTLPDAEGGEQTWETWSDDGGDRAYVRAEDGRAVIVYGTASTAELEALVGLLVTGSPDASAG